MAKYWWDRLKNEKKKRDLASDIGHEMSSLEILSPPDQMEAERKGQMKMQYTGAGEDGIVQEQNPVQLIPTIDGPRMLHEGEMNVQMPGGRNVVVPQRALKKIERELNIPGFQEGGEFLTNDNEVELRDDSSISHPLSGGADSTLAASDNVTYGETGGVDPYDPRAGIDPLDTWAGQVSQDGQESQDKTYEDMYGNRPTYDTDAYLEDYFADQGGDGDADQTDAVTPIEEPERPPVPTGVQSGYDQLLDMMGVDSKYWDNLRNEALTYLGATHSYDKTQLEQTIARGDYSEAQANAMRGRLAASHSGQAAKVLGNMAKVQANQQQALAQAAVTTGVAIEDAQNRWATWEQTFTNNQLTSAEGLAGAGWDAERINETLGTNFTEKDIELLGESGKMNRQLLEAQVEDAIIRKAKMWRMLGRTYDELIRDSDFLDEEGDPILTQGEYNLLIEPPETAEDFFLGAVASDKTLDDLYSNDSLRQVIMYENSISDPEDPRINEIISRKWDTYLVENKGVFTDNVKGFMLDIASLYGRGEAGWKKAQEDEDVLKWASYASGYDRIADRDKLKGWIKEKFQTWTVDEVDKAVTWFESSPYYSEVFADTPEFSNDLYRTISKAMTNETLIPDGEGGYTFTSDFVYPWYDESLFLEYSDIYGDDLEYTTLDDGTVKINGITEDEYLDQGVDGSKIGVSDWNKYGGQPTIRRVKDEWESYLAGGGDSTTYWDGERFDLKGFISNEVSVNKDQTVYAPTKNLEMMQGRDEGSYYYVSNIMPNSQMEKDLMSEIPSNPGDALFEGFVMADLDEDGYFEPTDVPIANGEMQIYNEDTGKYERINYNDTRAIRIFAQFKDYYGEDYTWSDFERNWGDGTHYRVNQQGIVRNFFDNETFGVYKDNGYAAYGQYGTEVFQRVVGGEGAELLGWSSDSPPTSGDEISNFNTDKIETSEQYKTWQETVQTFGGLDKKTWNNDNSGNSLRGDYIVKVSDGVYNHDNYNEVRLSSEYKETLSKYISEGLWLQGHDGAAYMVLSDGKGEPQTRLFKIGTSDTGNDMYAEAWKVSDGNGNEYWMFGEANFRRDGGFWTGSTVSVALFEVMKEGASENTVGDSSSETEYIDRIRETQSLMNRQRADVIIEYPTSGAPTRTTPINPGPSFP